MDRSQADPFPLLDGVRGTLGLLGGQIEIRQVRSLRKRSGSGRCSTVGAMKEIT